LSEARDAIPAVIYRLGQLFSYFPWTWAFNPFESESGNRVAQSLKPKLGAANYCYSSVEAGPTKRERINEGQEDVDSRHPDDQLLTVRP
jgi:hypothetical protein